VELATLWRAADVEGYPFGRLAQLIMLTGARRDELREARWSEFQLDGTEIALPTGGTWKGPVWTLPAHRAKNGREHVVPLSRAAVDILRKLPRISKTPYLFTTTGDTPISGMSKAKTRLHDAMLADLRKADSKRVLEPWSLHDLRRSFSTGLQRLGFSIEVSEACLNHTSGAVSGVAAIYARYRYLREKTEAFDAWARHVDALVKGTASDNVVSLPGERQ
jgi:integrase